MGGDNGIKVVLSGALKAARKRPLSLVFVGREEQIREELSHLGENAPDIRIQDAREVAEMGEKPSEVLRRKKDASIRVAFNLVKQGEADGVVSAGHSGATLGCGMVTLGRIKGIERPALATVLPTEKDPMVLIDVGANVDCKPRHLVQFALMADVLARDVLKISSPRVGILSIGEEKGKGNALVLEAYAMLSRSSLNFVGNVEGRDLFSGKVDVVVCDGFVGNVALKLSEGLAFSLGRILKQELKKSLLSSLGTLLSMRAFRRFTRRVDYAEYGGAPLLGLNGIAIVCHGSSNSKAIFNAVDMAASFIDNQANDHLVQELTANQELALFGRHSPSGKGKTGQSPPDTQSEEQPASSKHQARAGSQ